MFSDNQFNGWMAQKYANQTTTAQADMVRSQAQANYHNASASVVVPLAKAQIGEQGSRQELFHQQSGGQELENRVLRAPGSANPLSPPPGWMGGGTPPDKSYLAPLPGQQDNGEAPAGPPNGTGLGMPEVQSRSIRTPLEIGKVLQYQGTTGGGVQSPFKGSGGPYDYSGAPHYAEGVSSVGPALAGAPMPNFAEAPPVDPRSFQANGSNVPFAGVQSNAGPANSSGQTAGLRTYLGGGPDLGGGGDKGPAHWSGGGYGFTHGNDGRQYLYTNSPDPNGGPPLHTDYLGYGSGARETERALNDLGYGRKGYTPGDREEIAGPAQLDHVGIGGGRAPRADPSWGNSPAYHDYARGTSHITAPGDGTVDTTKAKLANGEAVLNRGAAEHLGQPAIQALNAVGMMRMGMVPGKGTQDDRVAPANKAQTAGKTGAQGYAKGTSKAGPKGKSAPKDAKSTSKDDKSPGGKPSDTPSLDQIDPKMLAAAMQMGQLGQQGAQPSPDQPQGGPPAPQPMPGQTQMGMM